jgi:alpha-glucosidase (family GH31 glycosyl hydrolase)
VIINQDEAEKGMAWAGDQIAVWKKSVGDGQYYGFGEKAGMFNREDKAMTMWNSDIPAYMPTPIHYISQSQRSLHHWLQFITHIHIFPIARLGTPDLLGKNALLYGE